MIKQCSKISCLVSNAVIWYDDVLSLTGCKIHQLSDYQIEILNVDITFLWYKIAIKQIEDNCI